MARIFQIMAITSLIAILSCAGWFPFEDYDYSLENLKIGIAYPQVRNENEIEASILAMKELGIDRTRIGCSWSNREPSRDEYYWGPFDTRMRLLADAGVSVLLTLETHNWPDWLPDDPEHDDEIALNEFREFISDLLQRYGLNIARIQFGNEWNWEIDDYFAGSEEAFIKYSNILAEETRTLRKTMGIGNPVIVLGSFSARQALAFDQGLIDSVIIEGRPAYLDRLTAYSALPAEERMSARVAKILAGTEYEELDVHFYDDFTQWDLHLQAYINAWRGAGGSGTIPVIASEFGGPYPERLYYQFGLPNEALLAKRIVDYVHTLDSMGLMEAYFFKLQYGGQNIEHPDSYLMDFFGRKTFAYDVMLRFGEN